MTTDFEAKAVMRALLLRLKNNNNKEVAGSSFNQPKTTKGRLHKIYVDCSNIKKSRGYLCKHCDNYAGSVHTHVDWTRIVVITGASIVAVRKSGLIL